MSIPMLPLATSAARLAPHLTSRRWRCAICGFVYDEAEGLPHEGLTPGTAWDDVPESWTCPDCGVKKADFCMLPFEFD
jgi:rubredoxin